MAAPKRSYTTIKEYTASLPAHSRKVFNTVRATVLSVVPDAEETISYNIPAFKFADRIIVSVGVWKEHIGMYPVPSGSDAFNRSIAGYTKAKSSVHFALDEPLPLKLIAQCVKLRLNKTTKERGKRSA